MNGRASVPGVGGRMEPPYLCDWCGFATASIRAATANGEAWACCTAHARMEVEAGRPAYFEGEQSVATMEVDDA